MGVYTQGAALVCATHKSRVKRRHGVYMLSRVLPVPKPPRKRRHVPWQRRMDGYLVLLGAVVFVAATAAALSQLMDMPLFPAVLRWWPATLAAAALAYTFSAVWFLTRAVVHAQFADTCVVMTTLCVAKLCHALLYTAATVVFMVGLPLASVTDLFHDGQFAEERHLPDHRHATRTNAVAAATTVWVLVAVSSALGAVLSVMFMVRMNRAWVFPWRSCTT